MAIKKDHEASIPPGEKQKPRGEDVTKWKKGRRKGRGRRKPHRFNLFT